MKRYAISSLLALALIAPAFAQKLGAANEARREMRQQRGWSQRELAKRAGIRHATIVALERGASPRLDTLAKLAHAFGVKVTQLLKETPK